MRASFLILFATTVYAGGIAPDEMQCYSLSRLNTLIAQPSINNGMYACCSDCIANTCPCTPGGTGTFALLESGHWDCPGCGAATTSSTTTTAPATTTTINFATSDSVFEQHFTLPNTNDRFGIEGTDQTAPANSPIIMPAHATASLITCRFNQTPGQAVPGCSGATCPTWTICLQQSFAPYDEVNFSDTVQCCTSTVSGLGCQNGGAGADIKQGSLITFHGSWLIAPPGEVACSALLQ